MRRKFVIFLIGSFCFCNAHAANWYMFISVLTKQSVFFFDRDTVSKQPGGVVLWVRKINPEVPDRDGSYATATKHSVDCKNRTMQYLTQVTYDKNNNHMQTVNGPGKLLDVVPGSLGESLYKTVCSPGFPSQKSEDYVKVSRSDIDVLAKEVIGDLNDPAQK